MITYYYAKPGVGKTTYLTFLALEENEAINSGKSIHKRVLTNCRSLKCPARIENNIYLFSEDDFGKYDMSDSLILWDEASFSFDKIDFKSLSPDKRRMIMWHRHFGIDIIFFNQIYSGLNNKIREICNETYELRRNKLTGVITPYLIEYDMHIPKKPSLKERDDVLNNGGDVKEFYFRANFIRNALNNLIHHKKCKAKEYYKYFSTYERYVLPKKVFLKVGVLND